MRYHVGKIVILLSFYSINLWASCVDLGGHYANWFMGTWIMKLSIEQTGCEKLSATYTLPTGETWTRNVTADGVMRRVGGDGLTIEHFEMSKFDSETLVFSGYTNDGSKLKHSWKGSWSLDNKNDLEDYSEEFNPQGVSQGPVRIVFLRE